MTASFTVDHVLDLIEPIDDDELHRYDEIPGFFGGVAHMTDDAALLVLGDGPNAHDVWFPLKQLRSVGKEVAASNWILNKKGLK